MYRSATASTVSASALPACDGVISAGQGISERTALILHLVTSRRRLAAGLDDGRAIECLLEQIRHAVAAGVDVVQIRERDLEAAALADIVFRTVALARGTRTRVIVNDRLDVALGCGAGGVHLRADSLPASAARRLAPQGFLVGQSVHSVSEAEAAAAGADYLIAGTVWPTESKSGGATTLGLHGFSTIAQAVGVPVLAIGGVTVDRMEAIKAAGAAGVAAIGLFLGSGGPGSCHATDLRQTVEAARVRFDTRGSSS
jgi:thiamine-phosphate pyrophosphorylase